MEELKILKYLIENKEFSKAYNECANLSSSYDIEISEIINYISRYNFGNALIKIDNYLFDKTEINLQQENNLSLESKIINSYSDFNGSYAQDIELFSDQIINDGFDGDPDNYWNVD